MYKSSTIKNLFIVAVLSLPISAISKEINYDFVQGTYVSIADSSLPGLEVDAEGFSISGSYGISQNIAISASYISAKYDRVLGLDVDVTMLSLGLTAHTAISPGTDIYGNISFLDVDANIDNGVTTTSNDDTGNSISVGLRHSFNDIAEFDVSLSRDDIYDDTDNIVGFGARIYINESFSSGISYETSNEDVDTIYFNVRIDVK